MLIGTNSFCPVCPDPRNLLLPGLVGKVAFYITDKLGMLLHDYNRVTRSESKKVQSADLAYFDWSKLRVVKVLIGCWSFFNPERIPLRIRELKPKVKRKRTTQSRALAILSHECELFVVA